MRAGAALAAAMALSACDPAPELDWKCDFEASVTRPLADPGATPNDAGELPSNVCGDTCGPPAHSCTYLLLDSGTPGAICPYCTF